MNNSQRSLLITVMLIAIVLCSVLLTANALRADPPAEKPVWQRISPFWTNIPQCLTTVNLHNNHGEEPLTVFPVLYLEDGSPVELEPVELPPLGSAKIEVNDTVNAMGYTDPHFGGAVFSYEAEHGGRLSVETAVSMPANNFLYSVESFTGLQKKSNVQHSAFWLPTSQTEVFYAAHNASDQPVTLRPKLQLWDEVFDLGAVEMVPKGFAKLRLTAEQLAEYVRKAGRSGASVVGGVTLEHDGPAEAVYAVGWLDDSDNGYSNMMSFTDPAAAKGQQLYGVQLFLGRQPGLAGPGKAVDLRTHVVLRNMTNGSVDVSATASYARGRGVETASLPPLRLAAYAVEEYDLNSLQERGVIPRDVPEVLLKAEYFAAPGSLIGRAYSISSDLSYGLYSVLESRGTGFFSGVYWSLQDDENTVFTIANVGEEETAARLELAHAGGKIELPALKLLPNQTQTINLRRDLPRLLQDAGKELPAGALSGGYRMKSVDDPLRAELLVKEHVLSASKKTAAPFYASCNYVTSVWLSVPSSPVQVELGGTTNVSPMCTWNVGGNEGDYGAVLQPDGGNEISISPTFGYTRTITGLNLGTRNMAQSSQVPRPPDPCEPQLVQGTPVSAEVNCTIGVTSVAANALTSTSGNVKFRVTNGSCPSGGSNNVRVAVTPIDTQGITIQDWNPSPPINVTVPSPGTTSIEQTLNFGISGSGSTKFRVAIDLCNGDNCSTLKWTLNPNNIETNQVNF